MDKGDHNLPQDQGPRINSSIRVRQVRLVDETGAQLGVIDTPEALRIASDRGLDLVEVSPETFPPVCKLMDYGKFRYQRAKKARENRQVRKDLKEIKIKPKIDDHDLDIKLRHARAFLSDGHKVKVTCRFRGREIVHIDLMSDKFAGIAQGMADVSKVDSAPSAEGKILTMVLAPTKGG